MAAPVAVDARRGDQSVGISAAEGAYKVNKSKVVTGDIQASSGAVRVIDAVMIPAINGQLEGPRCS